MGKTSPAGRELTAAILVVDDEPAIARALAYLLRRRGHQVDTAAHGRLALKKLQTRASDLILHERIGKTLPRDPVCGSHVFPDVCLRWPIPQREATDRRYGPP